jgi:hypothetical protein
VHTLASAVVPAPRLLEGAHRPRVLGRRAGGGGGLTTQSRRLFLHLWQEQAGVSRLGELAGAGTLTGGAVQALPSASALILSRYTVAPLELYLTRWSPSFGIPYCWERGGGG